MMEEKNIEIEKGNRMLYQKIRKIKLKNVFKSDKKVDISHQPEEEDILFSMNNTKGVSLPHVSNKFSTLNSTNSQLTCILEDRKTFVNKYFEELTVIRNNRKGCKT